MMKTLLVLCLALFVAFSFGCSKKEETPKTGAAVEKPDRAGKMTYLVDPVSMDEVDVGTTPYSYELDGVIYYFNSAENMEAFKADPQKYIDQLKGQE